MKMPASATQDPVMSRETQCLSEYYHDGNQTGKIQKQKKSKLAAISMQAGEKADIQTGGKAASRSAKPVHCLQR